MDQLEQVRRRTGGVFTIADAQRSGITRDSVARRISRGDWIAVRRGVYTTAEQLSSTSSDPRAVHLIHAAGAVLSTPDAWLSHSTAAVVHDLPVLGEPPARVQMTRHAAARRTPAYRSGLAVYASTLPDQHRRTTGPLRVTSPARSAIDLARSRSLVSGVAAIDAVMYRDLANREQLARILEWEDGWPGFKRAGAALAIASGLSETPLESFSLTCFHQHGVERPAQQIEIRDAFGFIGRCDFCWIEQGVIGEADGLLKYDDPSALREEKLRQERLERAGWTVIRWTWQDLERRPDELARRINDALARRAGFGAPSPWLRPAPPRAA